MVILVFFNVLKIANVRPLVGQKGPYIPTPLISNFRILIPFPRVLKNLAPLDIYSNQLLFRTYVAKA